MPSLHSMYSQAWPAPASSSSSLTDIRSPLLSGDAMMCRNLRPRQSGFTLIEVLVALTIVAIAMSAAVRAVSLMTSSNALLRDKTLALLAAESRLAEIRLAGVAPSGSSRSAPCDQGRLELVCEEMVASTEAPALVRITVSVREREGPPLARLESLLSRLPAKGRP